MPLILRSKKIATTPTAQLRASGAANSKGLHFAVIHILVATDSFHRDEGWELCQLGWPGIA